MARTNSGTKQKFLGICRHINRAVSPVRTNKGFTLVEILMVTGLIALLSLSLYSYSNAFNDMKYQYQTEISILNQARNALEKMVWGVSSDPANPRSGIWEATSLTVTSPTQLDYVDPDGSAHSIRLNDQAIEVKHGAAAWETVFDPNGTGADDNADDTSTQLTFTRGKDNNGNDMTNVVQIELVLGRRLVGRWYYASLSTQVNCRN